MSDRVHRVLEWKGPNVEITHPRTKVLAAVELMNQLKIGALIVTDGNRPLGIITERDILARVVAAGIAADETPVGEVMTRMLVTVAPHATIDEAMALMTDHNCRHLPVIEDDEICGLLSIRDLAKWMARVQQPTTEDLRESICHT